MAPACMPAYPLLVFICYEFHNLMPSHTPHLLPFHSVWWLRVLRSHALMPHAVTEAHGCMGRTPGKRMGAGRKGHRVGGTPDEGGRRARGVGEGGRDSWQVAGRGLLRLRSDAQRFPPLPLGPPLLPAPLRLGSTMATSCPVTSRLPRRTTSPSSSLWRPLPPVSASPHRRARPCWLHPQVRVTAFSQG